MKKKNNQNKKKTPVKSKVQKSRPSYLWPSKSKGFIDAVKSNSMIDYFTRLTILNPPSVMTEANDGKPHRDGRFVRLAHAKEEFEAPIFTKGKSASRPAKTKRKPPKAK